MSRRAVAIAGGVVALVVVVLIVLSLILPGIAKDKVRDEVGDDSAKVTIDASPSLKLLFGDASRIDVDTPTVAGSQEAPLGRLFERAKKVDEIHAKVGQINVQGLTLRNLVATVKDQKVDAKAELSIRELAQMVPGGGGLKGIAPGPDGEPRFETEAPLVGRVTAITTVQDGAVVVTPEEGLASLVTLTIFQDPSIAVQTVTGRTSGDTLRIHFTGVTG